MASSDKPPVEGFRRGHPVFLTTTRHIVDLIRSECRVLLPEPAEKWLDDLMSGEFAASRGTMRSALNHLSGEGRLVRRPRAGTQMPHPNVPRALDARASWPDATFTITLDRIITAPLALADRLAVPIGGAARMTEATIGVDGVTLGVVTRYVVPGVVADGPPSPDLYAAVFDSVAVADSVAAVDAAASDSAAVIEQTTPALTVTTAIEAVTCDDEVAALIDVPVGSPVLWRETHVAVANRTIALFFENIHPHRVSLTHDVSSP